MVQTGGKMHKDSSKQSVFLKCLDIKIDEETPQYKQNPLNLSVFEDVLVVG